ncbi:hypothetical protein [Gordonia sp. FQ]|uniref:hypothetical protein n=1 Tax=Gordonia sp. FQ TaxID=3446634 RepID=UPI003F854B9E
MNLPPRKLCVHERKFGRFPDAQFRTTDDNGRRIDQDTLVAAIVQHHLAIRIRDRIIDENLSQNQYAYRVGMDPNRLTHILCGHQAMTLTDIAIACLELGPDVVEGLDPYRLYKRATRQAPKTSIYRPGDDD